MKGTAAEVAIFADTNLGTRIAFNSPFHITAGTLKRDFEKLHFTCFPDIGEIHVHGLMVRRKSCFYHLPDSFPVKNVFPTNSQAWFLHLEAARPLTCDAATALKQCENKIRCNREEKREEQLNPSQENQVIDHVLKEKGSPHENSEHGMLPVRDSSTASKSRSVMPETNDELCAGSVQETPSKVSTQVISVSGIINKYFSGFNGVDKFSSSSNSDVTSRAVHGEIEVQSNTGAPSCSKKQVDSLSHSQFSQRTQTTPPHVPLPIELVSKNSGCKTRRSKVGEFLELVSKNPGSKTRRSRVGEFLLSASKSLGASKYKQSPALSLCKFKDKKVLEELSRINRSIFSICDSDD